MHSPGDMSLIKRFIASLASIAISRAQRTADSLLAGESSEAGNVKVMELG